MKFLDICKDENRGKWFEVIEGVAKGELVRITEIGTFEFKPMDESAEFGCNVVAYTLGQSLENVVSDKPYAKPYTLIEAVEVLKAAYHNHKTEIPIFESEYREVGRVLSITKDGNVGMAFQSELTSEDRFVWTISTDAVLGKWYLKE